jgi:hypothetical protein
VSTVRNDTCRHVSTRVCEHPSKTTVSFNSKFELLIQNFVFFGRKGICIFNQFVFSTDTLKIGHACFYMHVLHACKHACFTCMSDFKGTVIRHTILHGLSGAIQEVVPRTNTNDL